jgi:hypothetical protein
MGIRERGDVVLRTFALVCLGLSLDQVEGLTGRKSETIRGWLLRCIKDPSAWPQIANSLVSSFHVRTAEIKALSTLLLETAQRQGTFHTMTRRRVIALLKAKTERRRLSPAEHLWLRSKRGMNTEPGQDTEVAYRQFVRLYKRPRLIPLTKQQQSARERLRQRVELIVGEPIVVTPVGEFYRCYDDPRVGRWIQEIKRFDPASGAQALQQLSQFERIVLDNIQFPNQVTHNLALLEGARGTKVGSPYQEKMTISCLTKGIGVELGMFIGCVKDLAQFLRERKAPLG